MGGFFGVASNNDCVSDLFFGVDYHSHLGTKRGGMAVHGADGFKRAIHNIENSPFRTKFEYDLTEMYGNMGVGCISDNDPQPLLVRSHLGSFAIATVGRINNTDALVANLMKDKSAHFSEMSGGVINATELTASLINKRDTIVEGMKYACEAIQGSMSILLLTADALYAARDRLGRTPLTVGKKDGAFCAAFECFSYINLGFTDYTELGPGEIVRITTECCETVCPPGDEMKICAFLWVYYGYPSSTYEGVNVENMRYKCGVALADADAGTALSAAAIDAGTAVDRGGNAPVDVGFKGRAVTAAGAGMAADAEMAADCDDYGVAAFADINKAQVADIVAGIPDSGTAHAIGYANASGVPFSRPFIKYTPTWQRSYTTQAQVQREEIAKMKLIAIDTLIHDKKILLVEDSIVRGTQLREPAAYLYQSGAKEVHIRVSCPPILFNCKYLHFTRTTPETDLIARRVINERVMPGAANADVINAVLEACVDPDSAEYRLMTEAIRDELRVTSLKFQRLDDMIRAIGIPACKLCTHCWNRRG